MINSKKLQNRKIWEMNFDIPIVFIGILLYNQFHALSHPALKNFERGGLNERV
jgi:hypothetical protein